MATEFRFSTEKITSGTPEYSNTISATLSNSYQAVGLFTLTAPTDVDNSNIIRLWARDTVSNKTIKVRDIISIQSNVDSEYDNMWVSPTEAIIIEDITATWKEIANNCAYLFSDTTYLKMYLQARI